MLKEAIIRKRNGKYVVLSHDGKKILGTYDTHEEAVKRLRQIEYFKHHSSSKLSYGDPKLHIPGDAACSRCEEPSTPGNRVREYTSDIGIKVFKHAECHELDEKFSLDPVEAYIHQSSKKMAVYPVLSCDNPHCDAEYDIGDDNETDHWSVLGEPCTECGRGQLEYRTAGGTTNPYSDPAHGQGALQRFPMSAEPAAPMEQYGNNMDPNSDARPPHNPIPDPPGNGDIPGKRVQGTSTYYNIKQHLIKNHGFKEHWLTGYSPTLLLGLYSRIHGNSSVPENE